MHKLRKPYGKNIANLTEAVKILRDELDSAEIEDSVVQRNVQTIESFTNIAKANETLLAVVSRVQTSSGLTPRGRLEELLRSSEHAKVKSEKLLDLTHMRNGGGSHSVRQWMRERAIGDELERTRERISLPPGNPTDAEMAESNDKMLSAASD